MTAEMEIVLLVYLCAVSFVSFVVCFADKCNAKKRGRRRVPEKTLFLLSVIGGSVMMYLTMHLIRHKTKHKRFMIGLPVIIVLQVCAVLYVRSLIVG